MHETETVLTGSALNRSSSADQLSILKNPGISAGTSVTSETDFLQSNLPTRHCVEIGGNLDTLTLHHPTRALVPAQDLLKSQIEKHKDPKRSQSADQIDFVDMLQDFQKQDPGFLRLKGVLQMSAHYTKRGAALLHTRADHCSLTGNICYELASGLKLIEHDRVLAGFAGMLHDREHPPFSHAGDELLASADKLGIPLPSCVKAADLDHDFRITRAAERGPIANFIQEGRYAAYFRKLKIRPEDVACVLADRVEDIALRNEPSDSVMNQLRRNLFYQYRYLHDLVKNYGDRIAYLEQDYEGLKFKLDYLANVSSLSGWFKDLARVVEDPKTGYRTLAFVKEAFPHSSEAGGSLGFIAIKLTLRNHLFLEGGMHPATLVANAIIKRELTSAFLRPIKPLTVTDFQKMTETAALEHFSPQAIDWLGRGIECSFAPLNWWSVDQFNERCLPYVEQGELVNKLRRKLGEVLGHDAFFVGMVPANEKFVRVYECDASGKKIVDERTLRTSLPNANRKVFAVACRDLKDDELQHARSHLEEFMSNYSVDGLRLLAHDRPNDPRALFEHQDITSFRTPLALMVNVQRLVPAGLNFQG